ncbi:MAG: hypothetical protein LQ350_004711 [Teloschistes chrysophthalmus]|nr:MAG: hypothetical protein LQ350_004711 [Niorma chrysophthalma]
MPSGLPSFLTDTPASGPLRVAYVQSLVSEIINRRVFQHFLFTFDDLDNIFNEWADYLGSKSIKREAIWRQRTLHAAFSCPSSKPRINKFASSIIDDIVYIIKPFADKSKQEQILGAIKKIVKTAAETWRYARIELSRIRALPAVAPNTESGEEVLLTMFPCIKRDPLPDDIRPDVRDDVGCVYTDGQVLTRRSPAVLARRAELGERVTIPSHTQTTQDANPDDLSGFENSIERGSQQTVYPRRTNLPLIPRSQASRADDNEGSAPSTFTAQAGPSQQDEAGIGWLAEEARRNDYRGSRMGMNRRQEDDDLFKPVAGKQVTNDHSATESPVQSPANSGVETPQLSQRTTATTSSSTDEEEDMESTPKAKEVPDWKEAGGSVPGAW